MKIKKKIAESNYVLISLFIYLSFISIWLFKNKEIPSFDSSRYFNIFNYSKNLWNNFHVCDFHNLKHISKYGSFLWVLLSSFFTYILNITKIKISIVVNSVFFFTIFIFVLHRKIKYHLSTSVANKAILLILTNPIIFHFNKVLLPEFLSLTFLTLSTSQILDQSYNNKKNTLFKFFIYSTLAYITNQSTLIYSVSIFLLLLPAFKKNIKKIMYELCIFIVAFLILFRTQFDLILNHIFFPDHTGSWESLDTNVILFYFKSLFWQFFGLLNISANCTFILFMVISLLIHNSYKKSQHNINQLVIFISLYLLILSWVKPMIGQDFIVTGYRYQLPIIIIFNIFFAFLSSFHLKTKKYLFIFYLLFSFFLTTIQSLPSTIIPDFKINLQLFPDNQFLKYLKWNGRISILENHDKVISGGGFSKLKRSIPFEYQAANAIVNALPISNPHKNKWLTVISPLESICHNICTIINEKQLNFMAHGDYKNPFYSLQFINKINNLISFIPIYYYYNLSQTITMESDFIAILESDDIPEPEMSLFYKNLKYFFNSHKHRFKLLKKISINEKNILIYKNKLMFKKNTKYKIASNINKYQFAMIKNSKTFNYKQENRNQNLKTILHNNNYSFITFENTDQLIFALENNQINTLIIQKSELLPKKVLKSLIIFYQKGGNLCFLNGLPKADVFQNLTSLYDHTISIPNTYTSTEINGINIQPEQQLDSIIVKNGLKTFNFRPVNGNYFVHRSPVSHSNNLYEIYDENRFLKSIPLSFHSFHKNRWGRNKNSKIFFSGFKNMRKIFNNSHDYNNFIEQILFNFENPVSLVQIIPSDLIINSKTDDFFVKITFKNSSFKEIDYDFQLEIKNEKSKQSFCINEKIKLFPNKNNEVKININAQFLIDKFITLSVKPKDQSFQKLKCLIINLKSKEKTRKVKPMTIINKKLIINDKDFFKGVNYYPASNYDLIWNNPNLYEIFNDFKSLQNKQIDLVRMHYIHSKWYKHINQNLFQNQLPLVERNDDFSLQVAQAILEIANFYEIHIIFDIFSLIGNDMGETFGWQKDYARFNNLNFQRQQDIFLVNFIQKLTKFNNFSIDLINEPTIDITYFKQFSSWVEKKINIIKELRPEILVTIGFHFPGYPIKKLDYYSVHLDEIKKIPYTQKPIIISELWNNTPSIKKYEKYLSEKTKQAKKFNYNAIIPWGFAKPSNLYLNEGSDEQWEESLGVYQRSDKTFY